MSPSTAVIVLVMFVGGWFAFYQLGRAMGLTVLAILDAEREQGVSDVSDATPPDPGC